MQSEMGSKKRILFTRCCDGIASSEELHDMYAVERGISFKTFAKHVDARTIAKELGYAYGPREKGLRLSEDYAVRFYRSTFRGQPCYYMDWSAIDHIYLFPEQIAKLRS